VTREVVLQGSTGDRRREVIGLSWGAIGQPGEPALGQDDRRAKRRSSLGSVPNSLTNIARSDLDPNDSPMPSR
jgi:hypothetical protein